MDRTARTRTLVAGSLERGGVVGLVLGLVSQRALRHDAGPDVVVTRQRHD